MRFKVDLNIFAGPLDLLLYLVRKHELEVTEISVSLVTDQYLAHLEVLEKIDVNSVAEFLDIASTLIEIKSRMVLPKTSDVEEQEIEDRRHELVERLLEYKQFRDAAHLLEERRRGWSERFPRFLPPEPQRTVRPPSQELRPIELWDLVSALGRVMQTKAASAGPENIVYDDTPIHVFMRRIHRQVLELGRVEYAALFEDNIHRSTMIGMFLATLELVRHRWARCTQDQLFSEIFLEPGEFPLPESLDAVFEYDSASAHAA